MRVAGAIFYNYILQAPQLILYKLVSHFVIVMYLHWKPFWTRSWFIHRQSMISKKREVLHMSPFCGNFLLNWLHNIYVKIINSKDENFIKFIFCLILIISYSFYSYKTGQAPDTLKIATVIKSETQSECWGSWNF